MNYQYYWGFYHCSNVGAGSPKPNNFHVSKIVKQLEVKDWKPKVHLEITRKYMISNN
jgi:hypothetical protein